MDALLHPYKFACVKSDTVFLQCQYIRLVHCLHIQTVQAALSVYTQKTSISLGTKPNWCWVFILHEWQLLPTCLFVWDPSHHSWPLFSTPSVCVCVCVCVCDCDWQNTMCYLLIEAQTWLNWALLPDTAPNPSGLRQRGQDAHTSYGQWTTTHVLMSRRLCCLYVICIKFTKNLHINWLHFTIGLLWLTFNLHEQ